MRSFIPFAAAWILSAAASASAAAEYVLIPADKIYTAPDAQPLLQGAVLVKGSRIASVSDQRSRIAVPAGTQTSNCRGVVVAGFQNSHVHFMVPVFDGAATGPAPDLERAIESMLTRYGVTTAFDTGSDVRNTVAIRTRIEKGDVRGPRILTAGWPLYPLNGIPFYLRHLPKQVLDQLNQPKDVGEALAAVRANFDAGADATKLFMVTSPQFGTSAMISADVASAAVKETHARGKLVLAHPTSIAGIRAALQAGVDIIVHTTLGEQQPWDAALTGEMVAKRMSVVPTFKLWPYELAKQNVPKEISDRLLNATLDELRAFKSAGGQILFGTDVGYMHEFDPTDEYLLMSRAGLSAMDILATLTTAPAARWKESERRGRVAPGLEADLVVLAGDPTEDVKNFANVRCVFRAGKLVYASKEPE